MWGVFSKMRVHGYICKRGEAHIVYVFLQMYPCTLISFTSRKVLRYLSVKRTMQQLIFQNLSPLDKWGL
jgi:hypothetical protein